jgi:hypothetical protein
MRLNKAMKEAIINAIVRDIPNQNTIGKLQKLLQDVAVSKMPVEVKTVYDNPALHSFLNLDYKHFVGCESVAVYCERGAKLTDTVQDEIEQLKAEYIQNRNKINKITNDLRNSFEGINTSLQFRKAFPELVKYLPNEADVINARSLPVATNIITDLKQLGWKNGK